MKITVAALILFFAAHVSAQNHAEYLSGPFTTPQEVTETCLGCHEDAGTDILLTRHWNWLGTEIQDGKRGAIRIGKQNLINNFCIAVSSNWPRCTSCHIGYGWKDASFDHSDPANIDCLVCHDQSGTYKKSPTGAGMPADGVDLVTAAQSVGKPTRKNCGACHFDGGGGSGVKHGDLDDSMYAPTRELDVHMGGMDMQCIDCHTTEKHKISGASHGSMAANENHITCMNCHDEEVHSKALLNKHIATVACETCHIPAFARKEPTKTWWDWSAAGQDRPEEKDKYGKEVYSKMKGAFRWEKNVIPAYRWFNGGADYYRQGEVIDPAKPVQLNTLRGSIKEASAKIAPFKIMRGSQPYDGEFRTLIVPRLFGSDGYWKTFDWVSAARIGMVSAGLEFSGSVEFTETEMAWPINHMVAPKEKALHCTSCHGKQGEKRLDWKALGYGKDPITRGSRFKQKLVTELDADGE
ncbi:MAG: tetrathionate reductase family octaheme c-type cytochrome [Bacteroidetes bacterium]|nr:tetrathionate reductase family octaheme c-type cytochrome [Bacteroidota bacterium]